VILPPAVRGVPLTATYAWAAAAVLGLAPLIGVFHRELGAARSWQYLLLPV